MDFSRAGHVLNDCARRFDMRNEVDGLWVAGFGEVDLVADPGDIWRWRSTLLGRTAS